MTSFVSISLTSAVDEVANPDIVYCLGGPPARLDDMVVAMVWGGAMVADKGTAGNSTDATELTIAPIIVETR